MMKNKKSSLFPQHFFILISDKINIKYCELDFVGNFLNQHSHRINNKKPKYQNKKLLWYPDELADRKIKSDRSTRNLLKSEKKNFPIFQFPSQIKVNRYYIIFVPVIIIIIRKLNKT